MQSLWISISLPLVIAIAMDFNLLNSGNCKLGPMVCKLTCEILFSRERKTTRLMEDRVADLEKQVKDTVFLISHFS